MLNKQKHRANFTNADQLCPLGLSIWFGGEMLPGRGLAHTRSKCQSPGSRGRRGCLAPSPSERTKLPIGEYWAPEFFCPLLAFSLVLG